MREVFNDFMRLERRADGTVRIPLGIEGEVSDLSDLTPGEHIRVVYPGELVAEAVAEREQHGGHMIWYGVVASMDAIQDIHPDTLAEQANAGKAASA